MSKKRWFLFALAIAAGLGLGLYYGWVVSPLAYVDTNPTTLRLDFRADYTLMVAESFRRDQNIENAAQRLAYLGNEAPAGFAAEALNFAQKNNFNPVDISLLQTLEEALLARNPATSQPSTPATIQPFIQPTVTKP